MIVREVFIFVFNRAISRAISCLWNFFLDSMAKHPFKFFMPRETFVCRWVFKTGRLTRKSDSKAQRETLTLIFSNGTSSKGSELKSTNFAPYLFATFPIPDHSYPLWVLERSSSLGMVPSPIVIFLQPWSRRSSRRWSTMTDVVTVPKGGNFFVPPHRIFG